MAYTGRRDPRFVTLRRGGTLSDDDHRLLALITGARPDDSRPAEAITIARAWAAGLQRTVLPDAIADLVLDDMRRRAVKFQHRFTSPTG